MENNGHRRIIAPNHFNINIEPQNGPNETPFFFPRPTDGGLNVLMLGGWSKVDALAAHILAARDWQEVYTSASSHDLDQYVIPAKSVHRARSIATSIIEALARPLPPPPEEPKPSIITE